MGDTATIYGADFDPDYPVTVQVVRVDGSIVRGDGSGTPGSDTVTTDKNGDFVYYYLLDGRPNIAYDGALIVFATDTAQDPELILAATSFKDHPQFLLQGCSKDKGDCTQADSLTGWADGASPIDGWTSGVLKGWHEQEDVPYRLRMNLPKPEHATTYYITNEHDHMLDGVTIYQWFR